MNAKRTVEPIGRLTIEAASDSKEALDRFLTALEDDPHWKSESEEWSDSDKRLTLTLKVFPQESDEYRTVIGRQTHVTADERKTDVRRPSLRDRRRFRRGPRGDR